MEDRRRKPTDRKGKFFATKSLRHKGKNEYRLPKLTEKFYRRGRGERRARRDFFCHEDRKTPAFAKASARQAKKKLTTNKHKWTQFFTVENAEFADALGPLGVAGPHGKTRFLNHRFNRFLCRY